MKYLFLIAVLPLAIVQKSFGQNEFYDKADAFFSAYVKDGLVDYNGIKQNGDQLTELTEWLNANASLDATSSSGKATLINAYNLFVIKGIVDAKPVGSVMDITGFFDKKGYKIGGENVSLNQLEKNVLIKQTNDPRLHFVLVCAALGCPVIIDEAYRPESLEAQLDRQTRAAMDNPQFTRVESDDRVLVSKIFEWYRSDFTLGGRSVLEFINQYRTSALDDDTSVGYYEYDWTLNSQAPIVEPKKVKKKTSNLLQFTPSQLFRKGQYELNVFNNLYSQTSVWDRDGNSLSQNRRVSILTTNIQFTYGISSNARVNIGADLVVSSGSVGFTSGGQFQLLGSDNIASDLAITGFGPRVKIAPFKRLPFFSYQTSFITPIANDPEGQTAERDVFLALNRYQWRNQFFLDLKLTHQFRLFYQLDFNYLMRRNTEEVFFQPNFLDIPNNLFINYFPTNKVSLFVMGQYFSRYGNTALVDSDQQVKFGLLQSSVQLGAGIKYQATSSLGFELSYGDFVSGRGFQSLETGAGEVVNFGVRFIR